MTHYGDRVCIIGTAAAVAGATLGSIRHPSYVQKRDDLVARVKADWEKERAAKLTPKKE